MGEKDRHFDGHEHRFAITRPTRDDPTLVLCPQCQGLGKVFPAPLDSAQVQFGCSSCGLSKRREPQSRLFQWQSSDPTDSYFGYSLWLNIPCCGERLWVFNRRHWDLLFSYVKAEHRERAQGEYGWRNASIVSRLPPWISSKKNREVVVKALLTLKEKALWGE
ncbi:MAG: hypothetical protein P1V97_14160 [Planctomycetota bacterium]|nr:hypothetical protein [Planctomycetota bacterium]